MKLCKTYSDQDHHRFSDSFFVNLLALWLLCCLLLQIRPFCILTCFDMCLLMFSLFVSWTLNVVVGLYLQLKCFACIFQGFFMYYIFGNFCFLVIEGLQSHEAFCSFIRFPMYYYTKFAFLVWLQLPSINVSLSWMFILKMSNFVNSWY